MADKSETVKHITYKSNESYIISEYKERRWSSRDLMIIQ